MRRLLPLLPLIAVAACAAPAPMAKAPAAAPPAAAAGPTESCLDLSRIDQAVVQDDRTIDFRMRGGAVYRNTLPYSCPQLGFEKAFSYATSLTRLCSTDIITVIVQGGGPARGASCGLGKFVQTKAG
jgi:hypothetical protein